MNDFDQEPDDEQEDDDDESLPRVTQFRKQPAKAAKDVIYDSMLDGRWHSANELFELVGLDYIKALEEMIRFGYALSRRKHSFMLISRWPRVNGRHRAAEIAEALKMLTKVDHTDDSDENMVRAGTRPSGPDSELDLDEDEDGEDGESPFDDDADDESFGDSDVKSKQLTPKRMEQKVDEDDSLFLGDRFAFPAKAATTLKFAILAKTGSGKTSTGIVFAEEMARNALPFCVIDPMGVWWGLRAPSDPEHEAYPVLVIGGDHGDVQILPGTASQIADLVVARWPMPVVLDISNLLPDDQWSFVTVFGSRLYSINRRPLHLFIDEADEFAPQKPDGPVQKACLATVDRIVRRGRLRGIGVTLISQRSAVIHKNVLSQTDVMIAMACISPADLKSVHDWLERSVTPAERMECLKSLPGLPVGCGYVIATGKLNVFRKVQFRKKETYDSSATPTFEDEVEEPEMMDVFDVDEVRSFLASGGQTGQTDGDEDEDKEDGD